MDNTNIVNELNEEISIENNVTEGVVTEVATEDAKNIANEANSEETVAIAPEKIIPAIEAILFSMGEAVERKALANALGIEEKEIEKSVKAMMDGYEAEDRGIRIIQLENSYQLCTKSEYFDVLTKLVNMPKKHNLTDSLMETLSIIAYKQPITRQEIEAIRGVSCSHAINRLMEYNLVMEVGRLDAIGRPILFGTTEDFLRSFGVTSMDELPTISPDKIEDFKKEAMEEVNIKVEV